MRQQYAGARDETGADPADTLLGLAVQRARDYWRMAIRTGKDDPS